MDDFTNWLRIGIIIREVLQDSTLKIPLLKLETPPPTPPLEGRGEASPDPSEGGELAGALSDGNDGAAAPLPSRGGVGGGVSNLNTYAA